ncbi:hypothetical protein ONZ45_g16715 [Pleurotus djamor]|nr:hypothetical protein ONZ45_g16715 [Pleurotus djamor]
MATQNAKAPFCHIGNRVLVDALQATENLVRDHPEEFMDELSFQAPLILEHSVSEDGDIRAAAASVLCAFSSAKLAGSTPAPTSEQLSGYILGFMDSKPNSVRLSAVLSEAMSVVDLSRVGRGPVWALCLISAIVILCDGLIFYSSRALKTLVPPLGLSLVHPNAVVHILQSHVWNCLTWSFGNIHNFRSKKKVDSALKSEQAFQFLSQDLRPSVGAALVIRLFDVSVHRDVMKNILDLLAVMLRHSRSSVKLEGIWLLGKLLNKSKLPSSPAPSVASWDSAPFLPKFLFDGNVIRAKPGRLSDIVKTASDLDILRVPALKEVQILEHWSALFELWTISCKSFTDHSVEDDPSQVHLVSSWQALLLARAQPEEIHNRDVSNDSLQEDVTRVLSDILAPSAASPASLVAPLQLGTQMVNVLKDVLPASDLVEVAETILHRLVARKVDLSDPDLVEVWNSACSLLFSVASERSVEILSSALDLQTRRRLYGILSSHCATADSSMSWGSIAHLLTIPFRSWTMSVSELGIWKRNLQHAVDKAAEDDVAATIVLDQFMQRLGDRACDLLSDMPQIVIGLLSQLTPVARPPLQYLSVLDATLHKLYDPLPESRSCALHLFPIVLGLIKGTPQLGIFQTLKEIRRSICLWIKDDQTILSDDEYNTSVIPIYSASLDALRTIPLHANLLHEFCDLFIAAFKRPRSPGLGPTIFKTYWQASFLGHQEFVNAYPDALKQCLRAYDDVFGSHLAVDLSTVDSSSDHSITSIVASSQSPFGHALGTRSQALPIVMSNTPRSQAGQIKPFMPSPGSDNPFLTSPGFSRLYQPFSALAGLNQYSSQTPQDVLSSPASHGFDEDSPTRRAKRETTPLANASKRRKVSSESKESKDDDHFSFVDSAPSISHRVKPSQDASSSEDDYDSWEVGLSSRDISSLHDNFEDSEGSQMLLDLDRGSSPIPSSAAGTEPLITEEHDEDDTLEVSYHTNTHLRDSRSQTEPQELLHPSSSSNRRAVPLKRSRTTSSKLDVLQRAYALMQDTTGDSQISFEELAQAKALIQKLDGSLSEKMKKRRGG